MSSVQRSDARYWHAYPLRAVMLRSAAFAIPVLVSISLGILVSRLLPTPQSTLQLTMWWAVVLAVSTIGVVGADKVARRLLPLATLLRLSMLFPDRAPSRLKIARRVSGSRAIAAELERAHRSGVSGDRQAAAETILALVGALGDYDSRTRGHSERTQLYVKMLADELGLKSEDRGRLMWAALVHDIGKLKVPHEVLNKPSEPTDEEWHVLHSHPVQGAHLCEPLREWLGEWWYAIEQHHERFDGTGYPRGLAGKEISYGARIVSVADCYEVMTAARTYKRPMSAQAARRELMRCAGTQFDPVVVRAFLNISLGRTNRLAGPLAWLAQLLLIRPGPMFGHVFGATAGAGAAVAGVVALSLAPVNTGGSAALADLNGPDAGSTRTASTSGPSVQDPTPTAPTLPGDPSPTSPTSPSSTPTADPTTPAPGEADLVDDTLRSLEDVSETIDVLVNDVVPDGDTVAVVNAVGAQHGSTSVDAKGRIRYTPAPDYHGTDSFTYTAMDHTGTTRTAAVAVTVVSVNDAPTAVDDAVTLVEDANPVELSLLDNDNDSEGDVLTVTSVADPSHGSVASVSDGFYRYAPDANYHGFDELAYTVSDGHGGTATGTAGITVTPVNDPPVPGHAAYAASVAHLLTVGGAAGVLAGASDADGDKIVVVSDDNPRVRIAADGSLSYLPLVPGVVRVRYVISDGRADATGLVTITVKALADVTSGYYLRPAFMAQASCSWSACFSA